MVYDRSGTSTFLEARYNAFLHDESGIPAGKILKAGNFPYGTNTLLGGPASVLNLDTGGIAVDPFDDVGIWMAHAYSYKNGQTGQVDTAIGKVFGKTYSDVSISTGLSPSSGAAGERLEVVIHVGNGGDGRSRELKGHVYLRPKRGGRVSIGSFDVPALAPGAQRRVRLSVHLPKNLESGTYDLEVVLPAAGKEYSTKNNIASRPLHVKGATPGARRR